MTMLMHTHGPVERIPSSSVSRDTAGAGAARAYLAAIKRFCISALAVVAVASLMIAIVALNVIVYLPRFHY